MTRVEDVSSLFVAEKRAAKTPWGAIARMAGCSEITLRARFDPARQTLSAPRRPERDCVLDALIGAGCGEAEAGVITRLWMANSGAVDARSAVRGLTGGGDVNEMVGDVRRVAERMGLSITRPSGRCIALDPRSVLKLAEMAGLRGRR